MVGLAYKLPARASRVGAWLVTLTSRFDAFSDWRGLVLMGSAALGGLERPGQDRSRPGDATQHFAQALAAACWQAPLKSDAYQGTARSCSVLREWALTSPTDKYWRTYCPRAKALAWSA